MARTERDLPDLRVDVPTIEPDEAFLGMLAARAAGSAATGPPARFPPGSGWRVGLAAASVAVVVTGAAWVAASVTGGDTDTPPTSPVTRPTGPDPVAPSPGAGSGSVDGTEPGQPVGGAPDPSGSVPAQQQSGVGSTPNGTDPGTPPEQTGPPDHTGAPDHTGTPETPGQPAEPGHQPAQQPGTGTGEDNPGEGHSRGEGRNDLQHGRDGAEGSDRAGGGTGAAGDR